MVQREAWKTLRPRAVLLALCVALIAGAADRARGDDEMYSEEDFYRKAGVGAAFSVVASPDIAVAKSVIGNRRVYEVRQGDTFIDLARFYGLGYNEILGANKGVDPWIPDVGSGIQLPTEWVLPNADWEGVVVNIPEMRLYFFPKRRTGEAQQVRTFPVGLGRDDWRTPKGKFRVNGKTKNPTWVIPESIREEHIREKGEYDKMIPGGDPRNPLGKYRIELTMPGYRIHGTNRSYGVGMQVSHGCVRLYPEDIEQLFAAVNIGIPGEFIYQPVKVGARDGRVFVEVHQDIYTLTPGLFTEARRILTESGWLDLVDLDRVARAVEEQTGVPVDVTRDDVPRRGPDSAGDSPELL